MTAIVQIVTDFIGVPTSPTETAILYAVSAMAFIVTFDTVLGLFRFVGQAVTKL